MEFLLTRVLPYSLEYTEGISFSGGVAVRDLTRQPRSWTEVGTPEAAHGFRYVRRRWKKGWQIRSS